MDNNYDYDVITGNTYEKLCSPGNTVSQDVITAVNTIGTIATPPNIIKYKYCEDKIISDFHAYIDRTYKGHYKASDKVECFDAWLALGDATPTFRNTAMKYLWRYGRKETYADSRDDLFKALHYTLMCLYNDHYRNR